MQSVSTVQEHWLRLLRTGLAPREVQCAKVEEGHFVVVLAVEPGAANSSAADYRALESCLGSLDGTRAIYLDGRNAFGLGEHSGLRSWAGDCATEVESGARRALAVVQMETFRERIRDVLAARGWTFAKNGDDLKVRSGRFTELINVSREAVRMVLSRADFAAAARAIGEEMGGRLARDAELFAAFKSRFAGFFPATLDHFYAAYPEESCVAVGWDYWQLAERPAEEAAKVFEEGMKEIELLLQTAREERLTGIPVGACGRRAEGN